MNAKFLNWAPFLIRSKTYSSFSLNSLTSRYDSSSSAVCIRIQPMPFYIQSVLIKVCLLGSNIVNTGEDFTHFFNLSNISINSGVQAIRGICFLLKFLGIFKWFHVYFEVCRISVIEIY